MPAKPNPVVLLADKLVEVLHIQRDLGSGEYPLTLSRLATQAGPDTPADTFAKAIKHKNFATHALLAHVCSRSHDRVGRYGVEAAALTPLVQAEVGMPACSARPTLWSARR